MKKLLSTVAIVALGVFYVSGANADEPQASSQSRASQYKQVIQKFDKNSDGRLDERERAEVRKYFTQRYSQERTPPKTHRPSTHRPPQGRTHGHYHGRTHGSSPSVETGMKRWINQWPRSPRGADSCRCSCNCCKGKKNSKRRRPQCGTG